MYFKNDGDCDEFLRVTSEAIKSLYEFIKYEFVRSRKLADTGQLMFTLAVVLSHIFLLSRHRDADEAPLLAVDLLKWMNDGAMLQEQIEGTGVK